MDHGRKAFKRRYGCVAKGVGDQCSGQLEYEHIIPKSDGGCNCPPNVTVLCTQHHVVRHKNGDEWFYTQTIEFEGLWFKARMHFKLDCTIRCKLPAARKKKIYESPQQKTVVKAGKGDTLGIHITKALRELIEKNFAEIKQSEVR